MRKKNRTNVPIRLIIDFLWGKNKIQIVTKKNTAVEKHQQLCLLGLPAMGGL